MGKLLVYALSIFSETVAAGGTSFEQWKAAFKREYGSKREETKRRGVFESNMRRIDSHNALMHRSFLMAVNQFADLTTEEWRAQVLMPSRHLGATRRSGGDRKKQAAAAAAATTTLLPEALDWAADGYVTPVKNQQACGSCWAFSSTGVVESAWAIKQNLTGPSAVPSLSEQQILDCTSGEDWEMMGCGGGDMKVALRYMQQAQLSSEAYYPYQSVDVYHDGFSCGLVSHSADPLAAPQWGITSIADVDADDAALQTSLAASPVSVGLCAGSEWQFYSSGVLSGECCTDIDHGVLAVGYGVDGDSGLAYWKIKNSWATTWGEEGYIRLERLDDGVGMCAMLTYLTAVEVDEPKCSDEAFCNANGTASKATKASNVGGGGDGDDDGGDDWQSNPGGAVAWGCACECGGGHAGRQCEWECVGDDDCADAKDDAGAAAPFCSSDGFCAAQPSMPDGCGFDDGQGGYGEDDMTWGLGAGVGATCTGLFCGADAAYVNQTLAALARQPGLTKFGVQCDNEINQDWLLSLAQGLAQLPPLTVVSADVSFNADRLTGDTDLADFASAALRSQPSLLNFTLVATADGLSDAGAAALGAAIAGGDLQRVELMLRLNDKDDASADVPTHFITAAGAGALVANLGAAPALEGLWLSFMQDVNVSAAGVQAIGSALGGDGAFAALKDLELNVESTMFNSDSEDGECNDAVASLGVGVAALSARSLRSAVLKVGENGCGDNTGLSRLAEGLQCAVDRGVALPDFDEKCDCPGLHFDEAKDCIARDFDEDDDHTCFNCNEGAAAETAV